MKSPEGNVTPAETPLDGKDELTGLPGLRTWCGVYVFVIGCFVLWVALLFALTRIFS
ncbi:MAG: hypothetical protein ACLPYZ_06425 [Limisphaerales bacterium]